MKKILSLFVVLAFALQLHAGKQALKSDTTIVQIQDTINEDESEEDAIIEDIIENKKAPSKDKVQYFSQLTKYGFKNLFTKFGYNSSLPYSSQVNPHAEIYMQDYLRTHTSSLIKMKTWGSQYFNLIDNIFMQYGLPKELKYLAVIESNLSTGATSWVGAGGPWQFMPYTARDYGLVVNGSYDERRDYYKSTHAAARYLLSLYRQMHDWLLVIAAYNGGPGRVFSAMKKSGSKDFWALQYYLPEESRNHVKKFIATHYIMEGSGNNFGGLQGTGMMAGANPYTNSTDLTQEERDQTETLTISGKYNSVVIAKNIAMEISEFNKYNPGFDGQLGMNGQFDMILPEDKMQLFIANKYQILNECVQMILADSDVPNNKVVYPSKTTKKKRA